MNRKLKSESGQAVLIVLLSLAVVLIVVLYILSRSVTDISLSNKEESSLRAFSAAEAGVERALVIGTDTGNQTIGDANFSADVSSFARGTRTVVFPLSLKSGENGTFWFVGHNSNGTLGCTSEACFTGRRMKFCWGDRGTSASNAQTPAVEVSIFYRTTGGAYRVARAMLDPNTGRTQSNDYVAGGTCTIDGEDFQFQTTLDVSTMGIANFGTANVLQYATTRILYNTSTAHKVGMDVNFAGNTLLPSQGTKVDSQGTFEEANRRIEVYQLHPEVPQIFANVIYSGSGVTK